MNEVKIASKFLPSGNKNKTKQNNNNKNKQTTKKTSRQNDRSFTGLTFFFSNLFPSWKVFCYSLS